MLKPERGAPGSVRDTLSKEKVCVNSEDDALGVHQIHKDPATTECRGVCQTRKR